MKQNNLTKKAVIVTLAVVVIAGVGFLAKDLLFSRLMQIEKEVDENVKKAEQFPQPTVEDIFEYHFAEMIPELNEQLEYAREMDKEK